MNAIARPALYWAIAVLALLWNLVGLVMFWVQVRLTPQAVAALPPDQQQIHAAMPGWVYVFFGIAVVSGVLGSLGLLMRRRWAASLLLLSLLGVVVQMASAYAITPVWALTGAAGAMFPLLLVGVCLLLWLFARKAVVRGWLR
ncbi:MAG: hypothetical protein WA956_07460 [Stenotrophomonas sp.]